MKLFQYILLINLLVLCCNGYAKEKDNVIVNINPSNIYQGSCFVIDISSKKSVTNIRGNFFGKNISFYKVDKNGHSYKAWLAVPIEAISKDKNIYLNLFYGKKKAYLIKTIEVLNKKFPVQKINLPAGKISLLTSNALNKETAVIGGCFKTRSKKKHFEGKFIMPAPGEITSAFGLKRIYVGSSASWPHKGLDIGGYGNEKILASNNGKVILSSSMKAHGETIIIDHGLGLLSVYCHMRKRNVQKGKIVKKGEVIGILGKSGIATGEHLHFGISVNDVRVDPIQLVEGNITL